MATLHLHYNTLKYVLDTRKTNNIIFTKKYPVSYISNTLKFITLDVCHIINSYTFETIIYKCVYDGTPLYSSCNITNEFSNFSIYGDCNFYDNLGININSSKSLFSKNGYSDIFVVLNAYMKFIYNKHNYINLNYIDYDIRLINYIKNIDIHTIYSSDSIITYDRETDTLSTTALLKADTLSTTALLKADTLVCHETDNITIYSIIDHKQLKYLIIVIKCILDAIKKYHIKKNEKCISK